MTWLQRKLRDLRIYFGVETDEDRRERHRELLQRVTDYVNSLDRQELRDQTPAERPSRK